MRAEGAKIRQVRSPEEGPSGPTKKKKRAEGSSSTHTRVRAAPSSLPLATRHRQACVVKQHAVLRRACRQWVSGRGQSGGGCGGAGRRGHALRHGAIFEGLPPKTRARRKTAQLQIAANCPFFRLPTMFTTPPFLRQKRRSVHGALLAQAHVSELLLYLDF